MNKYLWSGWGVLPIILSNSQVKKLLALQPWQHWSENHDDCEVKDVRRFYTKICAESFRPLEDGRYRLDLNDTPFRSLFCFVNNQKVSFSSLQLIQLSEISLLYLHMNSDGPVAAEDISKINKDVFSWLPKTVESNVTQWKSSKSEAGSLIECVSMLLGIDIDSDTTYGDDPFGHELANCSWLKLQGEEIAESLCVSSLSAGIDKLDPRYTLSDKEMHNLTENQFSVWKDWRCQLNGGRLVFVDETVGESSLYYNLFKYNYYLDLFGMVIYQKLVLNHFKDELIVVTEKQRRSLYERIFNFRKSYKVSHMSTYPFAERLYQYLYTQAGIDKLEEKAFIELEHSYTLWKQEEDENKSMVVLCLSIIAALLLPASSFATIYSLTDEKIGISYLVLSSVFTLVTIIGIFSGAKIRRFLSG